MTNDMMYNWTNALKKTDDGAFRIATERVEQMRTAGFSAGDISDILVGEDFDLKVIDQVIKNAYASKEEPVQEIKVATYVVPTCYEDVKPFVEETLKTCSGREFMNRLAYSKYPIIKNISAKGFESFVRLAEKSKTDDYALEVLHKDLLPFVETTMCDAVVLAESNKPKTVVASVDDDKYRVSYSSKDMNDVSIKTATCTCEKYIEGNYAQFGLACEHIVSAVDVVSPNHKLPRNFVG